MAHCKPFFMSQIVMPPHLEKVRDRLAENIHELWAINKIELGWTYGKVQLFQKKKFNSPQIAHSPYHFNTQPYILVLSRPDTLRYTQISSTPIFQAHTTETFQILQIRFFI